MNHKDLLLSIIIPVYNEELTIGNVIDRAVATMQQTGLRGEVIVVDDHSSDRSLEEARKRSVRVCTLKQHLGKGYALRAGFARAKGDVIVTIDSDGSHKPEELLEVLAPILSGKADLVIGSRYLNHKHVEIRRLNAFGVSLFNTFIELFTGTIITDSQSGYRAMTREVLQSQKLYSGEYEIESEMLVKTAKKKFRITEVPISFKQRTYGRSGVDPLWDGSKILFWIILASTKG
jgi:glycosyltransferase involved in cell wall biosynthesis